jgi:hypothetical protein
MRIHHHSSIHRRLWLDGDQHTRHDDTGQSYDRFTHTSATRD